MKKWYLLYYKPRQYKNIASHLSLLNITYFMPMTAVLSLRADSLTSYRKYEVPYFAGYVFVLIDVDETHPNIITRISSAIDFVRTGGEIKEINEEIIIGLKIAPMVIDEIDILGSPPIVYCDNCSYDVLYEVIEKFHSNYDYKNTNKRVIWLLSMIDGIAKRKPYKPLSISSELKKKIKSRLSKVIDYKQKT